MHKLKKQTANQHHAKFKHQTKTYKRKLHISYKQHKYKAMLANMDTSNTKHGYKQWSEKIITNHKGNK